MSFNKERSRSPEAQVLKALDSWFGNHVPGVKLPLQWTPIVGGRSNLTFLVTARDGRRWVVRRPPYGLILPTAHDVGREFRILSALADTDVPVAPVIGFCDDLSIFGAPFYAMDYVDGHVVRDAEIADSVLPIASRRRVGESLVEGLVAIHGVNLEAVGLNQLGKQEFYVQRQLRRWRTQLSDDGVDLGRPDAMLIETHDMLLASIPEQREVAIVHGDYRLDNCIVHSTGDLAAVLDWELCTLGDPLSDVGLLLVYWGDRNDPYPVLANSPTSGSGFADGEELLHHYESLTGRDISGIQFYVALGYWKLACIFEGVYQRYLAGAPHLPGEDVQGVGEHSIQLARRAYAITRML